MKILFCAFVGLIFVLQLIRAANLPREIQNVRVKRDDDMIGAGVQAMAGLATSFMDVASKGGAAKDERDFQADIPFASFKGNQKSGVGVGDSNGEDYRRRKRSPCRAKANGGIPTTTLEPPADDGAERRKRQTINDPDNVRPQFDGKTAVQSFLDSFVELAKKIGNLFVPSDPNNPQTRQQEMDDRY